MRCATIVFTLVTLLASSASAQEDEAITHFDRGAALYYEEQYSASIVEFKRAHDIDPNPVFLLNIALAYWRLDNLDMAIRHAEQASGSDRLDAESTAQNGARVTAWRLRRRIEQEPPNASQETPPAFDPRQTAEPDIARTHREPSDQPAPVFLYSAIGLGALSVASFAALAVNDQQVATKLRAVDDAVDAAREDYDRAAREHQRAQRLSKAFLAGGLVLGGLAATTLIIHVVTRPGVAVTVGLAAGWVTVRLQIPSRDVHRTGN